MTNEKWLNWAIELQALAQAGLFYGRDVYDIERFQRIRDIAAEMLADRTELPPDTVRGLFCNETGYQTPKIETRAAVFRDGKILLVQEKDGLNELPPLSEDKTTAEQIELCFAAHASATWEPAFD